MKKKYVLISMLTFAMILCCSTLVQAAGYSFDLQYAGTVVAGEEKDANVLLVGDTAPAYTNVVIKVDVAGPATPKLLATDSQGTIIDIAQTGAWGPAGGFAVGGTFNNTTPIKATFPVAGTYTVTLTLQDVANANATIIQKTDVITVIAKEVPPENTTNTENNIEELPQTGTGIWEYILYAVALILIIAIGYMIIHKKKANS